MATALANKIDFSNRGQYGQLTSVPKTIKPLVRKLVGSVIGFKSGFEELNKKGGFEAHNWDIYGYDATRKLVVLQFRHVYKRKESWYTQVQKQYVLAGIDEGQPFFHILPSSPLQMKGLKESTPQEVVRWCESKIFGVRIDTLKNIVRQGDVAFVPVLRIPRDAERVTGTVTYRESHKLSGDVFEDDGQYYVSGTATLDHIPGQHSQRTVSGTYRVVTGERGSRWHWLNAPVD